jgi:hypothetical protein
MAVQHTFGRVAIAAAGGGDSGAGLTVETARPTVYWGEGVVELGEHRYDTRTFLWFYPPPSSAQAPRARGVRLTLGAEGFPTLLEVLGDPSDDGVRLYVSSRAEALARERHGEPLPGRRFSIEAGMDAHPRVLVVRELADGPVPMGPFVYLSADHEVTTLLCRCMATQADAIEGNFEYALEPVETLEEAGIPDPFGDPARLDAWLRLPAAL